MPKCLTYGEGPELQDKIIWIPWEPDIVYNIHAPQVRCGGSDGSGGLYTSDPRLRRAGWSWVLVDQDYKIVLAAYGTLPGKRQTVPRAELQALLHFTQNTQGSCNFYIDCLSVIINYRKLLKGWIPGLKEANGDLWGDLKEALKERQGHINVQKIDSHESCTAAIAAGGTEEGWVVNNLADDLAGSGAAMHAFSEKRSPEMQRSRPKMREDPKQADLDNPIHP